MNDGHALASSLAPFLHHACAGHLQQINWFHTVWQHGGAATGFGVWKAATGEQIDCVVKLPVGYSEYSWTKRLGVTHDRDWNHDDATSLPTPRVLAGGYDLGGYDLAWLIMERFPGQPLGAGEMTDSDLWELFETAAEFHAAAILEEPLQPERVPPDPEWGPLLDRALDQITSGSVADPADWTDAILATRSALPELTRRWAEREIDTWCHRDVHAHNAMRRVQMDGSRGRLALIDLARVAPGNWIEDALYFERLCWGRPERLCGIDPLTTLAGARQGLGLPTDDADMALADVRRVLMAATSPAFSRTQGDPTYLAGALRVLERHLPGVSG